MPLLFSQVRMITFIAEKLALRGSYILTFLQSMLSSSLVKTLRKAFIVLTFVLRRQYLFQL
jgi:hypothetical protein